MSPRTVNLDFLPECITALTQVYWKRNFLLKNLITSHGIQPRSLVRVKRPNVSRHARSHAVHPSCRTESTKAVPLIEGSLHRRQPVDGDRLGALVGHHRGQRDGARQTFGQPLLIHQVKVTVHPGHLVGSEMIGAVVI